jgi:glutamate-5-semialdehyde dehydrogenase
VSLRQQMEAIGRAARDAAAPLAAAPAEQRSAALRAMARRVRLRSSEIIRANEEDVASATIMIERLMLNEERVEALATAIDEIAALPDPVGEVIDRWIRPNGLEISQVKTPIGVIGMIYESRPNVTSDAAAICLRSGNCVILRSGSEALRSAISIGRAVADGLAESGLPVGAVQVVPTARREAVGMMLEGLSGNIDLIIPRGGRALVERVTKEARVPVLGHLEGVCHTYVHESADPDMAVEVVRNAKLRRVGICGATETLLIDRSAAPSLLPRIAAALVGCELRGDVQAQKIVPMAAAEDSDWGAEFLAPILAVKTVGTVDEAIAHIERFGTGHTEAIIAGDVKAAEHFLERVDSAIVLWNASTQFADGGEFGFGAEIGIATGKLHARGPVGPEQLTTFKYQVRGTGQVRP